MRRKGLAAGDECWLGGADGCMVVLVEEMMRMREEC